MHRALLLEKGQDGGFQARVTEITDDALTEATGDADVLVQLAWSTLNYKDGLAITNSSPVVRKWPMVAGIDGAGTVISSGNPAFQPGDAVVLNGWGVGETHWGCLAGKARLKSSWLVALPQGLSSKQAMAIGTAGYTAMLCVMALQDHGVQPEDGDILVTGAAGGVGSVAVMLLSSMGYRVVASTGRTDQADWLQGLGAHEVIDRQGLSAPGKPLQKERWAGAVDSVGSHTLANVLAQTRYRGTVAACGLAQGMDLPTSVAPFILRGVTLAGVDSVMCPQPRRQLAWQKLAQHLDLDKLAAATTEIGLTEAVDWAPKILAGQVRGRLVVDIHR